MDCQRINNVLGGMYGYGLAPNANLSIGINEATRTSLIRNEETVTVYLMEDPRRHVLHVILTVAVEITGNKPAQ